MGNCAIDTWKCGSPPQNGQYQRYPGRFIYNVRRAYPDFLGENSLHMFSGSCEWGVSTDVRPEAEGPSFGRAFINARHLLDSLGDDRQP